MNPIRGLKNLIQRPRPESDKVFNLYHPEFEGKIEEAFKCRGVTYYSFKKDTEIRTGRYMFIQNFLQEVFFRMDSERLKEYIARITSEIDGTRGQINIGNALEFLHHMKNLTQLAFEPDTVYRLASTVFFDDTEDLRTWDRGHNEKKIQGWREDGTLDFFYKKGFSELIGLRNISQTDMRDYLDKAARLSEEYRRVLNSGAPTQ